MKTFIQNKVETPPEMSLPKLREKLMESFDATQDAKSGHQIDFECECSRCVCFKLNLKEYVRRTEWKAGMDFDAGQGSCGIG